MDLTAMNNPAPSGEPTFEAALAELERIVRQLEDSGIGLDEAMERYEQGVALLRRCQDQLRQAEQRILVLTGLDETGQPVLQPFAHEATASPKAEPPRRLPRKRNDDSPTMY